ncbi:hypothetical protein SGRA_1142 [Saprospira grandis str. Lewin]|uniref:Uncharacterized protein n=1 Tax=Saprospira grandis (strain Lewin) TaxID=984262 RepID=H6L3Z5_SAPGL|nr:hypothetical protein SGRA_1142 [Saprospira grandis str. Lewin]
MWLEIAIGAKKTAPAEGWKAGPPQGGRPKAFEAKRKSLQGRAELRAAIQPDPPAGRGSPKKEKNN